MFCRLAYRLDNSNTFIPLLGGISDEDGNNLKYYVKSCKMSFK